MKSKILLLSFTVIFFTNTHAQVFHVGLKGGSNLNKISGESFNQQFTYSYHAGAFAEIGISKKWFIQPEVIFNQINSDTSSNFSKVYTSLPTNMSNIKLNYLSIPILLDYKLSKFFVLQAGPQFGILLNKNESLVQNGKNAFKSGDLSMLAGIQIKVASFRVYGRYAVGLSNINDIDNKDKWKSQSIQIGVGIALL